MRRVLILTMAVAWGVTTFAATPGCDAAANHKLDFWIGRWDVFDSTDGSKAGTSVLTKSLNGCVIEVDWHEADGSGEIKEVFYFERVSNHWKQVWIAETGATKERASVEETKNGGLQFLGDVKQLDGGSHLDRSTVTPLPGDRIHQVIETSRDQGKTWKLQFDAEYRRQK